MLNFMNKMWENLIFVIIYNLSVFDEKNVHEIMLVYNKASWCHQVQVLLLRFLDALELSSSFDEGFRFELGDGSTDVAVELNGISPEEKLLLLKKNERTEYWN